MIDLGSAQRYLRDHSLDAWLLYDFDGMNPIFWEVVGTKVHTTRPCTLFIPANGTPTFLVHQVDAGKFIEFQTNVIAYLGRADMQHKMGDLLQVGKKVAMEYSPLGALPVISRVDAGTIEFIRSLGVTVVSSADIIQATLARLDATQMATHIAAARKLNNVVHEAFALIAKKVPVGVTEYDVCDFIRRRFSEEGLYTDSGPVVAVNEHSGDPHYEPTPATSKTIRQGDWVLIDLWAKENQENAIFSDITWVGFVGQEAPEKYQKVFDVVTKARDLALRLVREVYERGETLEGWQVDECARNFITDQGYGPYFTHRLGHSLGKIVHSYAVNLDNFETRDTRRIVPGIAFTIEPGIYLPDFGVRSEINVVMTDRGPVITTPLQESIVFMAPLVEKR